MSHAISLDAIRGVVAMLPTPSTDGADRPDATFSIDLDETERATRALIAAGISVIMTNGSLGEMATVSYEEWFKFNEVVLSTARDVDPHFPIFVGATTLSTQRTIALARDVKKLGGKGIFVGRPFWCALDAAAMFEFYRAICEAVPDLSVVIYDNPEAFKGPIPTSVYAELAKLPQVLAAKCMGVTPKYHADVVAVDRQMHLLPIEVDWFSARSMWPDRTPACWSSTVICGPTPVMKLAQLLDNNDLAGARDLTMRIARTYAPFLGAQNFAEFAKYNIALEKARFDAAGFIRVGPARHPYNAAPAEYVEGSRETARLWLDLCKAVSDA